MGSAIHNGVNPSWGTIGGLISNQSDLYTALAGKEPSITILPINKGGTGTATPGLIQGTGITITGTWPNQTINAVGGGSGTPGGSTTQLQYNNSGAFGGISGATFSSGVLTLTSPVINSPIGLVKADVGLNNVDNTSDTTKWAASAVITNKTIAGGSNTITGISLTTSVSGVLPITNGGTGTSSPGLIQGTNVTITGSWPNQTINATAGGGAGFKTYSAVAYTSTVNVDANANDIAITGITGNLTLTSSNFSNGKTIRVRFDKATSSNVVITLDATTIPGIQVQSPRTDAVVSTNTITLSGASGLSYELTFEYSYDKIFGVINAIAIDNATPGRLGYAVQNIDAVKHTATLATGNQTVKTFSLPAIMTANSKLLIDTQFSKTGSNSVQFLVKFGGVTVSDITITTGLACRRLIEIWNRNATNSQVFGPPNTSDQWNNSFVLPGTASIDTTSAQNIDVIINMSSASVSASEVAALEWFEASVIGI